MAPGIRHGMGLIGDTTLDGAACPLDNHLWNERKGKKVTAQAKCNLRN
jgi:hypothetical protein